MYGELLAGALHLTDQRLEHARVDAGILAGLNASWTGSDDGMETVLVSSVVDPMGNAILVDERVLTTDNDHLNVLAFVVGHILQGTGFGHDLTVAQFVSVVVFFILG